MAIDWSKPVEKIPGGHRCRVFCTDLPGEYPVVVAVEDWDGDWLIETYTLDGRLVAEQKSIRIRNVPEKGVRYLNVYPDETQIGNYAYFSRGEADRSACKDRIACVRVEYTEGEFDE
jgi:hypothetical protein